VEKLPHGFSALSRDAPAAFRLHGFGKTKKLYREMVDRNCPSFSSRVLANGSPPSNSAVSSLPAMKKVRAMPIAPSESMRSASWKMRASGVSGGMLAAKLWTRMMC
jgi:hypothetical protein